MERLPVERPGVTGGANETRAACHRESIIGDSRSGRYSAAGLFARCLKVFLAGILAWRPGPVLGERSGRGVDELVGLAIEEGAEIDEDAVILDPREDRRTAPSEEIGDAFRVQPVDLDRGSPGGDGLRRRGARLR